MKTMKEKTTYKLTNEEKSSVELLPSSKNLKNVQISQMTDLVNKETDDNFSLKNNQIKNSLLECDLQNESITIPESSSTIKVYKRRWFIMFVYVFYAIIGSFQWPMYAIIANVITKYYNVSNLIVDLTTVLDFISFLATFLPVSWILINLGLRWGMLISSFLHALGCFLRIFSVASDRFWLSLIGQVTVGFSQVFVLTMPASLVATWFPANQASSAYALANNGLLAGNAIGLLFPPHLVRNSDNLFDIAKDLDRLYLGLAAVAFTSLLLVVLFFQEKPPLPPSHAQRIRRSGVATSKKSPKEILKSLKKLFTQRTFVTLLILYAFIESVFCVIVTLLNQILIPHFPSHEKEIGIAGLLFIVSGIMGAAICGSILDRTHAFKKTTVALCLLTLVSWIAFSVLLRFGNIFLMYISTAILGFSTIGVQVVGTEFVFEVTFPESEALTNGVMGAGLQFWGFVFTLFYGYVLENGGDNVANVVMTVPILIACVLSFYTRPKLKRQAAQRTEISLENIRRCQCRE